MGFLKDVCDRDTRTLMSLLLVFWTGSFQAEIGAAETYVASPENYLDALKRLGPGDRLSLDPGIYTDGLPLRGLTGSINAPVVIEGPSQGPPAVFRAQPGENTINIAESSHLVVRNLTLDGDNLPVDGIVTERRSTPVHHITLERLTIIGHGHDQSIVAIATRCPTAFWTIRDNTIIGAGTGMYLGGSDGSAPFVAGLIEGNRILDTIGYNIQIKHQRRQRDLPQLPQTPQVTVIRGNFLSKASGAGQAEMARPNLLIGHLPVIGTGSRDKYQVVNNVFYYNPVEVLLQGEGNLEIWDNIFVNPVGSAIAIRPHNDVPRQIDIRRNFVAAASIGVSILNGHPGYSQQVASNSVYAKDPLIGGWRQHNITGPYAETGGEFAAWLARERIPRVNGQTDWALVLKQMAAAVCGSFLAWTADSDRIAAGSSGIDRNCHFLRTLARIAAGQRVD